MRCLLANTGKLCRVFSPRPHALGKRHGNCQRQKPSTVLRYPHWPASTPLPPTPTTTPPRACSAGGKKRAGGNWGGVFLLFFSQETHSSSEANFHRGLSGESWATNIFADRLTERGPDWHLDAPRGRGPGARTPRGERS